MRALTSASRITSGLTEESTPSRNCTSAKPASNPRVARKPPMGGTSLWVASRISRKRPAM